MKTKAEFGAMLPQAKECLEPPELEEAKKDLPPRAFGESATLLAF